MNLLFFDCKIANFDNTQPKICAFSYLLCDGELDIIKKDTLYINPGKGENFDYIKNNNIPIPNKEYNYYFYRTKHTFDYFYEIIKSLISDTDTLVLGYNLSFQFFIINSECKRYNLPQIDISGIDIKLIEIELFKDLHKASLKRLTHYFLHRSYKDETVDYYCLTTWKIIRRLFFRYKLISETLLNYDCIKQCMVNSLETFNLEYELNNAKCEKYNHFKALLENNCENIIAFDIECANTFNGEGKICEFGYCKCDKNFTKAFKNAYFINPGNGHNFRFDLLNRKDGRDLHLKYEANNYEKYKSSPEFSYYIPDINLVFNQKETLFIGFAVRNDLNYLEYSYDRYNEKNLDIYAFDIQKLYMSLNKLNSRPSLEKVFYSFFPNSKKEDIQMHFSCDDAYATMLIVKKLTEIYQMSLHDLLIQGGISCFASLKYDPIINVLKEDKIPDLPAFDIEKPHNEVSDFYDELERDEEYIKSLNDDDKAGKRVNLSCFVAHTLNDVEMCMKIMDAGFFIAPRAKLADIILYIDKERLEVEEIYGNVKTVMSLTDFLKKFNINEWEQEL